jgi:hypothetical protein
VRDRPSPGVPQSGEAVRGVAPARADQHGKTRRAVGLPTDLEGQSRYLQIPYFPVFFTLCKPFLLCALYITNAWEWGDVCHACREKKRGQEKGAGRHHAQARRNLPTSGKKMGNVGQFWGAWWPLRTSGLPPPTVTSGEPLTSTSRDGNSDRSGKSASSLSSTSALSFLGSSPQRGRPPRPRR